MDLETLWDRANDAINTIIRLDETTETGTFLHPCIEGTFTLDQFLFLHVVLCYVMFLFVDLMSVAALNLGCTPRRTSRRERNNTLTCYLNIKSKSTSPNLNNLHQGAMKPCLSLYNLKPKTLNHKSQSVYPLYYGNGKDPNISYGEEHECDLSLRLGPSKKTMKKPLAVRFVA
ncbi:hypothetical protein L1987_69410 [Smallanthus sonchifolius]|uniref:Uncharacterized protein n=1 Tax=Smallanthus sonchifolius TaxID=185202 RepID=A0ACB9B6V5_9ASTR|nr:hypothetical protein L1987_69410 [Smallanthus sonchifolius]